MESDESLPRLVHFEVLLSRQCRTGSGMKFLRVIDDGGQRIGRSLMAEGHLHPLHQGFHGVVRHPVGGCIGVAELISLCGIEAERRRNQPVVGLLLRPVIHGTRPLVAGLCLVSGPELPRLLVPIAVDDRPAVEVHLAVERRSEGDYLRASEGHGVGSGRKSIALSVARRHDVAVSGVRRHLVLHLALGRTPRHTDAVGQPGHIIAEGALVKIAGVRARYRLVPCDGSHRAVGGEAYILWRAGGIHAHIHARFLIHSLARIVVGSDAIDVLSLGHTGILPRLDVVGHRVVLRLHQLAVAINVHAIDRFQLTVAVVLLRIDPFHRGTECAPLRCLHAKAPHKRWGVVGHILVGDA